MTENEWLTSSDPQMMLGRKLIEASPRKLRLFCVACCRSISSLLIDPRSLQALDVAERCMDEDVTVKEMKTAQRIAHAVWDNAASGAEGFDDATTDAAEAVMNATLDSHPYPLATETAGTAAEAMSYSGRDDHERAVQAGLLRDIFGNPYRPVTFEANWRTTAAVALANSMYESSNFAAMPVLADALEEAGCDNADILSHCRSPLPHVRGCWVVDGVLGKA